MDELVLHHPAEPATSRTLTQDEIDEIEPLLVDIWVDGELQIDIPPLDILRERRELDVSRLDPGVRRLMNPHIYHVSLTERLWTMKRRLVQELD